MEGHFQSMIASGTRVGKNILPGGGREGHSVPSASLLHLEIMGLSPPWDFPDSECLASFSRGLIRIDIIGQRVMNKKNTI